MITHISTHQHKATAIAADTLEFCGTESSEYKNIRGLPKYFYDTAQKLNGRSGRKEAFTRFISLLKPVDGSKKIWFRHGNYSLFEGEWDESGQFSIWSTKLETKGDPKSRVRAREFLYAFERLTKLADTQEGGIHYLPSQPQEFPIADCIKVSDDVALEIDNLSPSDQRKLLTEFFTLTRLEPRFIVWSGNKSYHVHWALDRHVPIEQNVYLRRLISIALDGDWQIALPHQSMRVPGFYRREKKAYQSLIFSSEDTCSYESFLFALRGYFSYKKIPFPDSLSDERFREYRKARAKYPDRPTLWRSYLTMPESDLRPRPPVSSVPYKPAYSSVDLQTLPLEHFVSKNTQSYIRHGVGSDRNYQGVSVARDLLGTYDYLVNKGFSVDGDPESLFYVYCQQCPSEGGWNEGEWRAIWSGCKGKQFSPSNSNLDEKIDFYIKNLKKVQKITEPRGSAGHPKEKFKDIMLNEMIESGQEIPDSEEDIAAAILLHQWGRKKVVNTRDARVAVFDSNYLSPENVSCESGDITLVRSPVGTGKTTCLKTLVEKLKHEGIINCGYRNTLLLQFNKTMESYRFEHLQTDKSHQSPVIHDPSLKVSLCIDSLLHIPPERFEDKIIILDEVESIINQAYHVHHTRRNRIKQLFQTMIQKCDRVIALDAALSNKTIRFFDGLGTNKAIKIVVNNHVPKLADVHLLDGTVDRKGNVKIDDKTPYYKALFDCRRPIIATDNQVFAEALDNRLRVKGKKGLRIDSKTIWQDSVKTFFSQADDWLEQSESGSEFEKIDYIIYSPSAESGLNISIKGYFTHHFGFFFGQLSPTAVMQMMARLRDTQVPKYLWCRGSYLGDETEDVFNTPAHLLLENQWAYTEIAEELKEIGFGYSKKFLSGLVEYYQDMASWVDYSMQKSIERNYEKRNYRDCVEWILKNQGYHVTRDRRDALGDKKEQSKDEKEAKDEVKLNNCTNIFNAGDKYIGLSDVVLAFDATGTEKDAKDKAKYVAMLPGIYEPGSDNSDSPWSPEFINLIKYKNPKLVENTAMRYLASHLDDSAAIAREKYRKQMDFGTYELSREQVKHLHLDALMLNKIGLIDFAQKARKDNSFEWTIDHPDIQLLVSKIRTCTRRSLIPNPRTKNPLRTIHTLLKKIGIPIKSRSQKQGDRSVIKIFSVDYEKLHSKEYVAIAKSIEFRIKSAVEKINISSDSGSAIALLKI